VGKWWQHERARTELRVALTPLPKFFATVRVAKHRLFVWMEAPTLPDSSLFAFARDNDYSFGLLQSRIHEVWSRRQATQLREAESGTRYTPRTCFLTFSFPDPTETEQIAIGEAAKKLCELRDRWLNPPEWTKTEVLEFPGTTAGLWARFVHEPNAEGIGTVRYERLVPKDSSCAALLQARTLTNLYNERPEWLANAHAQLDEAVFEAYGWNPTLSDEEILERLLALNLERTTS
jgi:hypothetical protein